MASGDGQVSIAQIAEAVGKIRFDRHLERFEFKPSIGIVAKQLQALGEELKDMREPLTESVKDVMTISLLENFMSGGRPDKWEELTYYTKKRRREAAPMILVRTGALADVASSPGIWSIGSQTAVIRDIPQKVWYGKVHQGGAEGDDASGSVSAGQWFKKYQDAARKVEGSEATQKEIDDTAYKLFDKRLSKHGLAPQATADIPARPWALFQEEDIDAIQNIFAEWVEEKLEAFGRM